MKGIRLLPFIRKQGSYFTYNGVISRIRLGKRIKLAGKALENCRGRIAVHTIAEANKEELEQMRATQYGNDEELLQKIEKISPSKQTACYQIILEEMMLQEAKR